MLRLVASSRRLGGSLRSSAARTSVLAGTPRLVEMGQSARFLTTGANEEGSSSFVQRLKQKMVKSFEESVAKPQRQKAEDDMEAKMMELLQSTPRGEFNLVTVKDFYTKLRDETQVAADGFIGSKLTEVQQSLELMKRNIRIIDGFTEYEQKYPVLIKPGSMSRVAKTTGLETDDVDVLISGCKSLVAMHGWMKKRQAQGLTVPTKPKEIQELMIREKMVRKTRPQGGFLSFVYSAKGAPRKKRLPA